MLKGRPLIYMILFFVSEALMVGASPFLFRSWSYEQAQVGILGLFAISAFLCLLLMKSLMAMIRRDASAQALETLKDMELEQLAAMVQTGQEIEAIRYRIRQHPSVIQDLEEDLPDLYVSRCDNPVADAILFRKSREMKEQNIRSHFQVSLPADLPLDSAILLSLLTNLLDNAIESCMKIEPASLRIIRFAIGCYDSRITIVCSNPYKELYPRTKHSSEDTKFLSSKSHKNNHGLGLMNIREITEKYNGTMDINTADNIFTITLCLKQAKIYNVN